MNKIKKELPKFFEQILNITESGYIAKREQQRDTNYIYVNFKKMQSSNTMVNITTHTIRFKGVGDT